MGSRHGGFQMAHCGQPEPSHADDELDRIRGPHPASPLTWLGSTASAEAEAETTTLGATTASFASSRALPILNPQ